MLAKVLKKDTAENFAAIQFPNIGETANISKEMHSFIFPNASNFASQQFEKRENIDFEISSEPKNEQNQPLIDEETRQQMIEEILQSARTEAAQIIAQAEAHKSNIEQAAMEKGLIEARNTFETEVSDRVNAEILPFRESLTETIAKIAALESDITSKIEQDLVEFSLEIAKKVVGREVTIDREVVLTLVKISLAKLHSRTLAKIHLNPEDIAFIDAHRDRLNFHGALELIEDRSISSGGCLIRTETGDIDARIESQFDEITHGLLGK